MLSLAQIKEKVLRENFGLITPERVDHELKSRSDVVIRKMDGQGRDGDDESGACLKNRRVLSLFRKGWAGVIH